MRMTRQIVLVIALVAVAGLAAFLLVRDVEGKRNIPGSGTQEPPPSKENVSSAIRERIEHLRQVVEKDQGNMKALIDLARLLQDSHNAAEAAVFYEEALKLDPRNADARIDYALCLHETGKRDAAMEQCRIVLRDHRGNPQALFNLGSLHANTGQSDSALSYWGELVRRHPDHALAAKAKENIAVVSGKPVIAH